MSKHTAAIATPKHYTQLAANTFIGNVPLPWNQLWQTHADAKANTTTHQHQHQHHYQTSTQQLDTRIKDWAFGPCPRLSAHWRSQIVIDYSCVWAISQGYVYRRSSINPARPSVGQWFKSIPYRSSRFYVRDWFLSFPGPNQDARRVDTRQSRAIINKFMMFPSPWPSKCPTIYNDE